MHAIERRRVILNFINEHESATTAELSALTNSSIATVRRDLTVMNQDGTVMKTHGGAKKIQESDIPIPCVREKNAIAKIAANLIHPGEHIFIGSGKTCTALARGLKDKNDLRISTTSINVVAECSGQSANSVFLLGGNVNYGASTIETLGDYTFEILSRMYFDKTFFTIDGADIKSGYSIVNRSQIPLYEHLIKSCKECYLLADHFKFGKRSYAQLCGMSRIPNVITDSRIGAEYLHYYQTHGIRVMIH